MTWGKGETIVLQEVWNDRVWAARPMTVVSDEGDSASLWFPHGTRWMAPTTPETRPRESTRGERLATCLELGDWAFVEYAWDVSTLMFVREGDWHALWISWLETGEHLGWYVNLQRPVRRTRCGFETMDLALDLVFDPDRSWRWKDQDELELFVERGVFDAAMAERIRAEALDVVARAERDEPPFSEPWPEWRPDPTWSKPELPDGWDVLCR